MLQAQQLSFQLNDQWIIRDLNFSVQPGQCLHIQGVNGAGKSTVLKLLAGLLTPSSGEVLWQGRSIAQHLSDYHASLAFVGHRIAVKPMLSVAEQTSGADENIIKSMELSAIINSMGEVLSAGQKQRVALTKLLSKPAQLWLLDEPFTALDQQGVQTYRHHLQQHCERDGMVVISSHQALKLDGVPVTSVRLGEQEVAL